MCAIFGSFSKEKLFQLAILNSSRGNFSYSITLIDMKTRKVRECVKGFGSFFEYIDNSLNEPHWIDDCYYVCHIQAPTSATTQDHRRIHPSVIQHQGSHEFEDTYLWHNGVLKHDWYTKSAQYDPDLSWDTDVLHREFTELYSNIENVDGQFSCVYLDKSGLYLFRNSEAPMFVDDDMNISSTYYDGARSTKPGQVYEFNFEERQFDEVWDFKCKSNAYYFGDEE